MSKKRGQLLAAADLVELSTEVLDVPPHMTAGRHEVRRDPALGGPACDASRADAERLGSLRGVHKLRHGPIIAARSSCPAALGSYGATVSIDLLVRRNDASLPGRVVGVRM